MDFATMNVSLDNKINIKTGMLGSPLDVAQRQQTAQSARLGARRSVPKATRAMEGAQGEQAAAFVAELCGLRLGSAEVVANFFELIQPSGSFESNRSFPFGFPPNNYQRIGGSPF